MKELKQRLEVSEAKVQNYEKESKAPTAREFLKAKQKETMA